MTRGATERRKKIRRATETGKEIKEEDCEEQTEQEIREGLGERGEGFRCPAAQPLGLAMEKLLHKLFCVITPSFSKK